MTDSPFTNRLSTRWFYESPVHEEALARLFYLIEQRRGFGLLNGGPGTGKTLALHSLCEQVRRSQRNIGLINLIGMDAHEMLWQIAVELGLAPQESESRWHLWRSISDQLRARQLIRTQTVLVFDHLERADATCYSLLERLFSVADDARGMVTFIASIRSQHLSQHASLLGQLSDLRVELTALRPDETASMISVLMERAGAANGIFEAEAVQRIHLHSRGCPRLISRLCELSLIAGMAQEAQRIDADLVDSVAEGLVTPYQSAPEMMSYPEYV